MGQQDEVARLTEAVVGLEQAITGMAAVLAQQGQMLQRLLEASTRAPGEDARLHELLLALIGRLDAQVKLMTRVEGELERIAKG